MNVVKHYLAEVVSSVAPADGAAVPLPMASVAMVPGNYVFNGVLYDCRAPGLYRFWTGNGVPIENRIVAWLEGRVGVPQAIDLYAFMSAISWNHTHGIADEALLGNLQALAGSGRTHKWRLTCGAVAQLLAWWLPQYGYPRRIVSCATLEPANGVDDGHIMIEVLVGGRWLLWDVTNGCYFTDTYGVHLSLEQVIGAGVLNCIRVPIDGDEKRGSEVTLNGQWCFSSYQDLAFRTQPERDAWYQRIFQSWTVLQ